MHENRTSQDTTFQLFRLPREKNVLDFVLRKLGEGASPDRYELLESLLGMYRTSVGFDPFALSKGRFRRLKASDFKQMLFEIDAQIGVILSSEEYKFQLAAEPGVEPLFREYVELSQGVVLHPALSLTSELEHLELSSAETDYPELLLSFYRNHAGFLEEVYAREGPEAVLEKFNQAVTRQSQLQEQFRIGFSLIRLEQQASRGIREESAAQQILEEAGRLLTLESKLKNRCQLLIFIARAAVLTATPARNLSVYLDFLDLNLPQILLFRPDSGRMIQRMMATYHLRAGREKRLFWLEQAEAEARKLELHDERPDFRFIRCMIEADEGDFEAALKALNDAEHLIYKASSRSLSARNNWVLLSEYRTLLFVVNGLSGDQTMAGQLTLLQQLGEDMGRHRHELSVMMLEWKALQSLLMGDLDEAREGFERAKTYRKNTPLHPWMFIDRYFVALLSVSKKKSSPENVALELEQLGEPFYTRVITQIFRLAPDFIAARKLVQS